MKASLEATVASLLIGHQLAFFLTLATLVVLVLLGIAGVLWRARKRAAHELAVEAAAAPMAPPDETQDAPTPVPVETNWLRMWRAFHRGMRAYRGHAGHWNGVYAAPWILVLGEEGAGKTALLEGVAPNEPATVLIEPQSNRPVGCSWWFYDEAVVIEVPGHVIRARGALSDAVSGGAWLTLLRLLRWHRPRRPLDALVVAVPVTDLIGPSRLDPTALRQKAIALQLRLFQAQSALGFCLPVHIVLTHGDALPGLSALIETLPSRLHDDVFGWASPYPLDSAYAAAWLSLAFEAIDTALLQMQLELHAAGALSVKPEALFHLESNILALHEPLELFLGTLFRRTVFQESLFFRGFYITAAPTQGGRAIFARHVFQQKIFAERDLSRPTPAFALGAGRRRRIAQAFAGVVGLLLLGGIWREGDRASTWAEGVVPVLRHLANPQGAPEERVRQFAADISELDMPFHSPLLPASWLGWTNETVTDSLALGYRRTLLGATRDRLDAALHQLVAPAPPPPPGAELDQLRSFVNQVGAVEAAVGRYDVVAADPTGGQITGLLAGIWAVQVPPEFQRNINAWHMATVHLKGYSGPEPLALAPFHAAAMARLEQLADAACDHLASGGTAVSLLTRVAADLAQASEPNSRVDEVIGLLTDARNGLHEAAPEVGADPDSWAGTHSFAFSPGVQAVLDGIGQSALLGPTERDRIIAQARRRFAASDETTRLAQSVVGPLLTRDAGGQIVLAPVAVTLESTLTVWLNHAFLRVSPPSAPHNDGAGWNPQMLNPAGTLADDYLAFEAKDIGGFPAVLQPVIRNVSRLRLQQNLLDVVLRANGTSVTDASEAGLHDQVMRLAAAAPRLVDVLHTLDRIEATRPEEQLRNLVRQQATMMLNAVDRLIAQDALYQPSLAALQASPEMSLPNYLLFGQPDAATLEQTLGMARLRVSTLARGMAGPLVGVLALPEFARTQQLGNEGRWAATIAELDKFEGQRPGNAVAAIERLILVDLADPTSVCAKIATPDLAGYGIDIFSLRRRQLRAAVAAHCSHMSLARMASGYAAISEGFDRLLAGRYPFGRPGSPDVGSYALLSFYDIFDRNLPGVTAVSATPDMSSRPTDTVLSFISALQAARPLVAPATATGEDVSLQVDVQFRANRGAEQGGDQIIEWRLTTGAMSTSSLEPHKTIVWHPGDPVQISLRWAKDGHAVPIANKDGLSRLEGYTLNYNFGGAWALLSMLQALHSESVWDGSGNTIALPFRVQEGNTGPEQVGRVFANITLHRVGATAEDKAAAAQRLTLPRFPLESPPLNQSSTAPLVSPRPSPGVFVPRLLAPGSLASE